MSYHALDLNQLPSPCFVVSTDKLRENLAILQAVGDASGAKILLALKAFSMFSVASLVDEYLSGTCASGPYEARLGREQFSGEVHTFSAAYSEADIREVLLYSDHVVFNSLHQWLRFRSLCLEAQAKRPHLKFGLRVNPEHSEGATAIYDPCAPYSRLGIPLADFNSHTADDLAGISGLHFHTLCEQDFLPLSRTLDVIEEKFGHLLKKMEWVNFGGGHHITRADYQREKLIKRIKAFRKKYQVEVIIEPGEAID
ncbi:MAG: carboxynorspermidine decarboxylase, partial [Parachlamydiaceae bacterium]